MTKKYSIGQATTMLDGSVVYHCCPVDRETAADCLRSHGWSPEEIESGLADCDEGNWLPVSNTISIC